MNDVECATIDPEIWWLDDESLRIKEDTVEGLKIALTVCNRCPVADKCLELSLGENNEWGIWGGYLAGERFILQGEITKNYQRKAISRARKIRQVTGIPMRGQTNETKN